MRRLPERVSPAETRGVLAALAAVVLAAAAGPGCEFGIPAGQEPYYELNWTDMGDQPKVKPQRADLTGRTPWAMFAPPAGAVAVDEHPYRFTQAEADVAGQAGASPPTQTPALVAKGKTVYTNFCIVCHGPEGAGDGHVTKKFPAPPSLMRQKVRDYSDARIFHVPMRGQKSMPSYAKQLEPAELWAVVAYIRDLQQRLPVAPPSKQDLLGARAGARFDDAAAAPAATGATQP